MTPPVPSPSNASKARRHEGWGLGRALLQLTLSLGALVAVVTLAAYLARDPLDALGRAFVERFGLLGMFAGTYLADAFFFPIPPQLYLLTAITGGGSQAAAVAVISAASLLAGTTGYRIAGRVVRVRFLARRIQASRPKIDRLFERFGYWAIAIGSLTPVPFSVLCYLAGMYRIPQRYFVAMLLFRVPRLVVFYALIRLGWTQGA